MKNSNLPTSQSNRQVTLLRQKSLSRSQRKTFSFTSFLKQHFLKTQSLYQPSNLSRHHNTKKNIFHCLLVQFTPLNIQINDFNRLHNIFLYFCCTLIEIRSISFWNNNNFQVTSNLIKPRHDVDSFVGYNPNHKY